MVCGGRAVGWIEVILEIDDREGWASLRGKGGQVCV